MSNDYGLGKELSKSSKDWITNPPSIRLVRTIQVYIAFLLHDLEGVVAVSAEVILLRLYALLNHVHFKLVFKVLSCDFTCRECGYLDDT